MSVKHVEGKRCHLFRGFWPKGLVICLSMIVMLFLCEQADARKKRKRFVSPVKVEEIETSPDPFIIGQTPMTLSMMVKVPVSAVDNKVLEVSALITSPTRKSMSFVTQRLSLAEITQGGLLKFVPVELVWDGKDQYQRLVPDGSYFYEIQAKVMEDKGNGPRTKIVSHRVQGTLEALAYVGEVLPPLPPEPEVPAEIEALEQEELAAKDLSLTEGGVIAEEDTSIPGEDVEGSPQVLEGSAGAETEEEIPNGTMEEDFVPGEVLLKEADSIESVPVGSEVPSSVADQISDQSAQSVLDPIPTDSSSPSEKNPFQH